MRSMRNVLSLVVAVLCVFALSSCELLPSHFFESDESKMNAQMALIADAVDSHDAAALKALFCSRAVQEATDLDIRTCANSALVHQLGGTLALEPRAVVPRSPRRARAAGAMPTRP
jgi:hypothetical protein